MASAYVPGPCPIFVKFSTITSAFFLGISERGVSIQFNPEYSNYVVDAAGSVPADKAYQGTAARITADLTRWSESVYRGIAKYAGRPAGPVGGEGVSGRGTDNPGDIGTLMATESQAYRLLIPFPYANKAAYSGLLGIDAEPLGYQFYQAFLADDSLPERGARSSRLHLNWDCVRQLVVGTSNPFGLGNYSWILYDHDMDSLGVRTQAWT